MPSSSFLVSSLTGLKALRRWTGWCRTGVHAVGRRRCSSASAFAPRAYSSTSRTSPSPSSYLLPLHRSLSPAYVTPDAVLCCILLLRRNDGRGGRVVCVCIGRVLLLPIHGEEEGGDRGRRLRREQGGKEAAGGFRRHPGGLQGPLRVPHFPALVRVRHRPPLQGDLAPLHGMHSSCTPNIAPTLRALWVVDGCRLSVRSISTARWWWTR